MRGETLSSAGARRRVQRPIDDGHENTPGDPVDDFDSSSRRSLQEDY